MRGNPFHYLWLTWRVAFRSLISHRLRSALAVLGILIGVTAVIWLVAIGEGISFLAQQQIKELGSTNIIVRSIKPPPDTQVQGDFLEYGLLRDDFHRILANLPTIQKAVPMREIRKVIRYNGREVDAQLVGCTVDYSSQNHLSLARGRFLGDQDENANVAVIADEAAARLFPYEDPIGKSIRVDSTLFVVIGQTANRSPSASIGGSLEARDYNLDVYVPLSTLRERFSDRVMTSRTGSFEGEIVQLSQITFTVGEMDEVDQSAGVIRLLLEKYHDKKDYSVVVPKELLRQAKALRILFNILLVVISGISLLVGGIGIMNIMLATVTERTREIGIRRALGARRSDIIYQFLTETVVLSSVGGLLGVVCGFLCGPVLRGGRSVLLSVFPDLMAILPAAVRQVEPQIAVWSIVAAFAISVGTGIVFGMYPARRAAWMDPIDALRHE